MIRIHNPYIKRKGLYNISFYYNIKFNLKNQKIKKYIYNLNDNKLNIRINGPYVYDKFFVGEADVILYMFKLKNSNNV